MGLKNVQYNINLIYQCASFKSIMQTISYNHHSIKYVRVLCLRPPLQGTLVILILLNVSVQSSCYGWSKFKKGVWWTSVYQ